MAGTPIIQSVEDPTLKGKRKNEEYLSEARSLLTILIACLNVREEKWKRNEGYASKIILL